MIVCFYACDAKPNVYEMIILPARFEDISEGDQILIWKCMRDGLNECIEREIWLDRQVLFDMSRSEFEQLWMGMSRTFGVYSTWLNACIRRGFVQRGLKRFDSKFELLIYSRFRLFFISNFWQTPRLVSAYVFSKHQILAYVCVFTWNVRGIRPGSFHRGWLFRKVLMTSLISCSSHRHSWEFGKNLLSTVE